MSGPAAEHAESDSRTGETQAAPRRGALRSRLRPASGRGLRPRAFRTPQTLRAIRGFRCADQSVVRAPHDSRALENRRAASPWAHCTSRREARCAGAPSAGSRCTEPALIGAADSWRLRAPSRGASGQWEAGREAIACLPSLTAGVYPGPDPRYRPFLRGLPFLKVPRRARILRLRSLSLAALRMTNGGHLSSRVRAAREGRAMARPYGVGLRVRPPRVFGLRPKGRTAVRPYRSACGSLPSACSRCARRGGQWPAPTGDLRERFQLGAGPRLCPFRRVSRRRGSPNMRGSFDFAASQLRSG